MVLDFIHINILNILISDIELLCVYIKIVCVIIGSCYMYIPDEVFHDWKLIRIKEEYDIEMK